jgi:cobalt/nickel transport system permease protein
MHIPDGFLDAKTFIPLDAGGAAYVALAASRVRRTFNERAMPLMAVLAAFIFAAQMLNFPVAGGTSGHFCGAALAAILLGPWAAGLILTVVLVIQALAFGDGGVLALGANVFIMGIVAPWAAWGIYRGVRAFIKSDAGRWVGTAAGAWVAIVAAATACALELTISGTVPGNVVIPAMAGIHGLIGIGEAIITVGALAAIRAARPDVFALAPGGAQ